METLFLRRVLLDNSPRKSQLLLRYGAAESLYSEMRGSVNNQPTPAAADIKKAVVRAKHQIPANRLELVALRVFQ